MRILHVATLITPDGSYGGPVRVATNQVRALRERGHDAVLLAAASGFDRLPTTWDGVPVRTFRARRVVPGTGFAGLAAPGMRRWVRAHQDRFDVAHVHLARDLVTLPAAHAWMRTGGPLLAQTHGMVAPSRHLLAGPLDRMLTRRVVGYASQVLALTDQEERDLRVVFGPRLRVRRLVNGVPLPGPSSQTSADGGTSGPREVLFLARLHRRKRPLAFVRAAAALTPRFPDVQFTLVGPDEGEGPVVRAAIDALPDEVRERVRWEGGVPPDATLARLARASVYVLPSVDEPLPMSVLEAMSVGVPVVVTQSDGLADAVERAGAGVVVPDDPDALVEPLAGLLTDPADLDRRGASARRLVEESFSVDAVADALVVAYAAARSRTTATDGPTDRGCAA
ncbi:glycosyltransferase [Cellulosimicrobium terreum]|nr:glycosyltransferase [Cellulosimicrobium terreum]